MSQKKAGIKVQTTTTAVSCIHRNTTIAGSIFAIFSACHHFRPLQSTCHLHSEDQGKLERPPKILCVATVYLDEHDHSCVVCRDNR